LTLTHRHLAGMSVLAIAGELDRTTSAQLADYIERVRRPADHVVFDLGELSFMDSSSLHVVLDCARRCAIAGTGVHLAAARGAPARLLTITGVNGHPPVYATVEQALTAALATTRTS
jgi:anti-sigma B factor antagonist